ncbi:MAG: ParB/RepB/Spo0J family partition protein [Desulfobacteraceae bacterium]|nr:ParB/RepB/Spo0J family partition protein [Desulfobacteraceae bacterium]
MRKNKPVLRRKSPLAEALTYAEALNNPAILSQARVGAIFGVSRARVCQVLSLLNLDESIKKYLLAIEDPKEHNFFSERKLRQIALIKDKKTQTRKFGNLVEKMKDELTHETD